MESEQNFQCFFSFQNSNIEYFCSPYVNTGCTGIEKTDLPSVFAQNSIDNKRVNLSDRISQIE